MSEPATVDDFLELVRKSGVVSPSDLKAFLRRQGGAGALSGAPRRLAEILVLDELLTPFQAEQFLRGRWRGFTIGQYKVLQSIGSGGMGDVFLCEHLTDHRRQAIKVLPPQQAKDPLNLQRFHREASIVTALDHPNLVRAYETGQDGDLHFLVMEYINGSNLQDIVTKNGPLPFAQAADYIRQAALGLQYFHQASLVHRDIKPSNILVDRKGAVKILDMGLARFFQDGEGLTQQFDDRSVLGTADYLSPEQARSSSDLDIRSDIYSLGITFYFLLAGRPPFADGRVAQKLLWHQVKAPQPIRELRPEVPENLAAILHRMLAKEPGQRYPDPAALAEALAPWSPTAGATPPKSELFGPILDLMAAAKSLEETPCPDRQTLTEYASGQTDTILTPPPATAREAARPSRKGPRYRWIAVGAAVLIAVGLGIGLWRGLAPKDKPDKHAAGTTDKLGRPVAVATIPTVVAPASTQRGSSVPKQLYVTRAQRENAYRTLHEALAQARPGDSILLGEEVLEEPLRLTDGRLGNDISIESGFGRDKPVRWRAPASHRNGQALWELTNVSGLRLKGIVLDGQDRLENLVTLTGRCPGLTFEDIHFQGFTRSAVQLTSCAGDANRPVDFVRVRTTTTRETPTTLHFETGVELANQHIRVRDSRFEGPCQAVVQLDGTVDDVLFEHNRFFKVGDCFRYRKASLRHRLRLTIFGNTFANIQRLLHFETLPSTDKRNRLVVQNNLFINAAKTVEIDGLEPEIKTTKAQWIWSQEDGDPLLEAPAGDRYFRRAFVVPGNQTPSAVLHITCDDLFTVWLNGQRVGQGEYTAHNRHVFVFNVPRLLPAKNVLAIQGTNRQGSAGLLVQLDFNAGGKARTLVSDGTWWVAAEERDGWQDLDFDDSSWQPARVLAPYAKGPIAWRYIMWDALAPKPTENLLWPVITNGTGNWSYQGAVGSTSYPYLVVQPVPGERTIATDPGNDAAFLRYRRSDPLSKLSPQGSPVGVPPIE